MNRDFRDKLDGMLENKSASAHASSGDSASTSPHYAGTGNVRNLCFALPDKEMQFLNYSYLVSGKYSPQDGFIHLEFTTHTVKLKGVKLEMLFLELMQQIPRIIACAEDRYNSLTENEPAVNTIEIKQNN